MKHSEGDLLAFQHSLRHHNTKPKSREVSSRFLSLTPLGNVISSPTNNNNNTPSPIRQRGDAGGRSSSSTNRKHRSTGAADSGFMRGLWPASSSSSTTPTTQQESSDATKYGTLAECFRNERKMEMAHRKNLERNESHESLNRIQFCKESNNEFENDSKIAKENHKPLFGGSMRYTGKFKFPGRSSKSSSSSSSSSSTSSSLSDDKIVPGRLSVDETALRRRSLGRKSDYLLDLVGDSGSEQSDVLSGTSFGSPQMGKGLPASYMAPTVSSRMAGIEVSSKYFQDSLSRCRRIGSDSGTLQKPSSAENSPKKSTFKNAMKRSNSMRGSPFETAKMVESPGRASSPTVSEENNKGKGISKPPTSPSKVKGVGNLLSIGLELLKGKKTYPTVSSPIGLGIGDSVHQLRLFHNRLVQWRYANARAEVVNGNITKRAERNLICAWDGVTKLRNSVRQKKMQIQKQKLEMKLNLILKSEMKSLEAWGGMERQHQSAITMTKDSLQAVVCKVPLMEGAKVEPHSLMLALRTASDITGTIKMMNSKYSPTGDETAATLRELAEIVIEERLLLEECLEYFKIVSALEVRESSLKCNLMQLKLRAEKQHEEICW